MAFTPVLTQTILARTAGAIFGLELGNSYMVALTTQAGSTVASQQSFLNTLYTNSIPSSVSNATVAAVIAGNLGYTDLTTTTGEGYNVAAYITTALNSTAYAARGSAVNDILSLYSTLTTSTTVQAWNTKIANAEAYAAVTTNTANAAFSSVATVTTGGIFTLTTGVDTWGSATATSAQTFNASVIDSLSSFDTLTGNSANNDILNANISAIAIPAGITVTGIKTAIINGTGATLSADVSTWTGLTSLTTANAGATGTASTITAATTTSVNSTVNSTTGGALTISGGNNVTTTQTGSTGGALTISGAVGAIVVNDKAVLTAVLIDGGTSVNATITGQTDTLSTITIGNTTKPTGAITLVASGAFIASADDTTGAIIVKGGTIVNITDNLTTATVTGEKIITGGTVDVTGASITTSVTVNQTATATKAAAATGVTGTAAVTVQAAAPGTKGIAAVTGVNYTVAVTAKTGVVNGAVTITDSALGGAGSIASVALAYNGAASIISSNALTSLSLTGGLGLTLTRTVANSSNTLALTANAMTGANTIIDTNNEITTLNVTTTGAASKLVALTDTGFTTLTVAGNQVFTFGSAGTIGNAYVTSIAVSGSAGFSDTGTSAGALNGFAARGAAATLTTTSSGAITASIDATTQTFVGSTGKTTITMSGLAAGDATKVVTGGSGSTDELILAGAGAYALTAAKTGVKVTGFETLGIGAGVTGSIDMTTLATGFTGLHIIGAGIIAVSKVAAITNTLTQELTGTSTTIGLAAANGSASTFTLNLGTATSATVNFGTIVLKDANAVGLGTVNIVSNGLNFTNGAATPLTNTMILTDNGLNTLNFSGTSGMIFTNLDQLSTQATSITINNTNTSNAGLVASTLEDTNLGSLAFTGTGLSTVSLLTVATSTTLGISNTGTQTAIVAGIADTSNMTSLTLTGNVQVGTGLVGSATGAILSSTAGITISGATDHASVRAIVTGAIAGNTDNITLGNGNNSITDTSGAATAIVNVTVGTGSNKLSLGNGAHATNDSTFNVTLGSHTLVTGPDSMSFTSTAGANFASLPNYVVTGAVTGDIVIADTGTLVGAGITAGAGLITATVLTSATSVTTALGLLQTACDALAAHGVAVGVYGGNTYIVEDIADSAATAVNTYVIELVGSHTITAATAGVLTVSS